MEKQNGNEGVFPALGLRPATPADEPFLRALFASTRTDEFALMNLDDQSKETLIAMQFHAQSQQYAMSYPDARNSIILWDGVPIGRLAVNRGEREFTLVDISLLPTHRSAGIGTHLLENLLLEATAARKPIKLNVWHSNPARNLYQRLGFSTVNDEGMYCEMRWSPEL
jgi:ribosomal protein S18 acetylase RimI-like enzyme